jgi:isopenicillin N synthase-like dioxygenase
VCARQYDEAGTLAMRQKYPFFYPKNIWPKDAMPELEPAFKTLGKIMYEATVLLTKQIDALAQTRLPTYETSLLYNNLARTQKIKGRVLYYYPAADTAAEDGWIAWHNDSGFLTALTSDMFFNDETGEIIANPDPQGGLWIVDRSGGAVKVNIPEDNLAVQCGECLQIMTGGLLVATPHAVKYALVFRVGQRFDRGPCWLLLELGFGCGQGQQSPQRHESGPRHVPSVH